MKLTTGQPALAWPTESGCKNMLESSECLSQNVFTELWSAVNTQLRSKLPIFKIVRCCCICYGSAIRGHTVCCSVLQHVAAPYFEFAICFQFLNVEEIEIWVRELSRCKTNVTADCSGDFQVQNAFHGKICDISHALATEHLCI